MTKHFASDNLRKLHGAERQKIFKLIASFGSRLPNDAINFFVPGYKIDRSDELFPAPLDVRSKER